MSIRINFFILYAFFIFWILNITLTKRNDIYNFNDIEKLTDEMVCNESQVYNEKQNKCIDNYCLDKENQFYYNEDCVDKCPNYWGWNELYKICRNCSKMGLFFENYKCVKECSQNSKKAADEKICFQCEEGKFYSYGDCLPECKENSITHFREDYCTYCPDDQYYFNNKCINKCEEPYISKKVDPTHNCSLCDIDTYYVSGNCYPSCGLNAYSLEEDRSCHLCFCNDNGKCTNSSICKCDYVNYFGDSCEFYRKDLNDTYRIIPLNNKALFTNVTFFTFEKSRSYKKIKWEFYLNNDEVTSNPEYKKFFITGTNEEIFGIGPNLDFIKYKKILLRLKITCNNDEVVEKEIRIYGQKLDIESEHTVKGLNNDNQDEFSGSEEIELIPMKYKIEIEQTKYTNSDQYKFYYKFSFLDEYNEEFPLSDFITPRSLRTYYIPFAKKFIVTLKNDRGEITSNEANFDYEDYFDYKNNNNLTSDFDKYNNIEKIFNLMILFKNGQEIPQIDFKLKDFINSNYKNFLNEDGFYKENNSTIKYAEPKLLFALINYIIINQKESTELINESLKKCVDSLNDNVKLSKYDIISLIRTIENLYCKYNEKDMNNNDNTNKLDYNELFNKINNYLSLKLYPGEGIKIIGNKTILLTYRFGEYDKFISILSDNITSKVNISDIKSYSYEDYGLNENTKINNEETFLYFNESLFDYIKNYIKKESNNSQNIALNVFIVNNIKNDGKNNSNDNYLVNINFFDLNKKTNINNIPLKEDELYSIKFNYKNENKKNTDKKNSESDKFYAPYNYSNVFCYPKNYEKNKSHYCYTYFDYKNNIIECKCNVIDEISIIEDKELSNFYKSLQFESVNYDNINKVSKRFIFVFLILLLIPGLIFLLYDIFKINKYINNKEGLSFEEKRRDYYNDVKIYTDTKYSFPIYVIFNKFPYCQAFNPGFYTSPKYIRHLIVITGILLGFVLNLIPFFFFIPFEEKQILIDKRDINVDEKNIHSIEIIYKYFNLEFFLALISLICVHIFIRIFNKILKIDEKNSNYWKKIKDLFKDYVYFKIKKNIYLGKNFSRIKNRMKAVYNVCGRFMLNKNIMNHPERNKKLENYLKYTGKMNKTNILNINNKIEVNDNNDSNNKNALLYQLPKNDEEENNIINTGYEPPKLNIKINLNPENTIDINSVVLSSYGKGKNLKISDNLKKLKVFKSENFQINKITDNKFGLTNNSICRFEKIKNRYITTNKPCKPILDKKNINKESTLTICHNNNLSIYNVEEYNIINENDISGPNEKDYSLLIIMTCVLGTIFLLLLVLSVVMIKKLMNEFEYFMVKIWMLCTILVLFIIYFLIYFVKIIIASILLFNCYHSRNKGCFIKFMFKIFVDKSLIYMFKVRNYITKYRREFVNI